MKQRTHWLAWARWPALVVVGFALATQSLSASAQRFSLPMREHLLVTTSDSAAAPRGTFCGLSIVTVAHRSYNCRVRIECGAHVAYGDGTSGLNTCRIEQDGVLTVHDPRDDDGDPALSLLVSGNGASVIANVWSGTWRVAFSGPVVPPTPWPRAAPGATAPATQRIRATNWRSLQESPLDDSPPSVTYVDLNGDGYEEAVWTDAEGIEDSGSGWYSSVEVYSMLPGDTVPRHVQTIGGQIDDNSDGQVSLVSASRRGVVVARAEFSEDDARCCPHADRIEQWRWNGQWLEEDVVRRRVVPRRPVP
mgnify:CR=1 FL=1